MLEDFQFNLPVSGYLTITPDHHFYYWVHLDRPTSTPNILGPNSEPSSQRPRSPYELDLRHQSDWLEDSMLSPEMSKSY